MNQPASNQHLIESLNESQRAAVEHTEGPLLVIAGPGSGKTRVIVHRIANMIASGIPSHQIVAMTFTNKAAEQMRSRLSELVPDHFAWTGTFHRFCSRLLRSNASYVGLGENFTIIDYSDSKKALKTAIAESKIALTHHTPDQILHRISNAKSRALTPEAFVQVASSHLDRIASRIYPYYQQVLRDANAMDFDDMLLYVVTMLRENQELRESLDARFRYMIVDEYQDTNTAQYLILKGLSQIHRNLAVTGDPDQSIYGWRGASLGNILDFESDFPDVTVVRLEQNYRSTRSILSVADQLIINNQRRKHKELITDNDEGIPVSLVAYPSQKQEAESIADTIGRHTQSGAREPRDFAIFYRVNAFSRSFEHALQMQGIPYQVVHGQEFYQRLEVKDLLAWLNLLNNPSDNLALARIINVPPRKIGEVTIKKIRQYAEENRLSLLDSARQAGLNSQMSAQAAAKVAAFVAIYDRLSEFAMGTVEETLGHVLQKTGYRTWLELDDSEEGHNRIANVDELLAATQEFDNLHPDDGGLQSYLETAVLVNDTDSIDSNHNAVTLMTLHAAKGLEFKVVFIVGVEEGSLPHERSMQDEDQLEEERRLLFVGITRAEEELQLSRALYRFRRGANWPTVASRFLMELPRDKMTIIEPRNSGFGDDIEFEFNQEADSVENEPWFSADSNDEVRSTATDYKVGPKTTTQFDRTDETPRHRHVRSRIQTAAELMAEVQSGETPTARLAPESYHLGMLVNHPEYGEGKVIVLGGHGRKRLATIEFFDGRNEKFVLAFCPLQPAASP